MLILSCIGGWISNGAGPNDPVGIRRQRSGSRARVEEVVADDQANYLLPQLCSIFEHRPIQGIVGASRPFFPD